MRFIIVMVVIAILSGCATPPPTPEELRSAGYGPPPTDYQKTIRSYFQTRLKDPSSAQIRFANTPTKGWQKWSREGLEVGYGVCVEVNAKNSYGGYTGSKLYYFLINRDQIIEPVLNTGADLDFIANKARAGCARITRGSASDRNAPYSMR